MSDYWLIGIGVYLVIAFGTFWPVLKILLKPVALHPGGPSFQESPNFSEAAKLKLAQHYDRLRGSLGYWKNQAEKFRAFHNYCLAWTIAAAVLVPILAQAIGADGVSKWLLTIVSIHGSLLVGLSKGFRVEQNYKAFRASESEFYDLYRRFLDAPDDFGDDEDEQLATYFSQVELIRRTARLAELDNIPTIEDSAPRSKPKTRSPKK
jgi:hypothetical protein